MDILTILRVFNIVMALTCVAIWIMYYKGKKSIASIAPISWLFNFLMFAAYSFVTPHTSEFLYIASIWTGLLCTHVIVLLLVLALTSGVPLPAPIPFIKKKKEKT